MDQILHEEALSEFSNHSAKGGELFMILREKCVVYTAIFGGYDTLSPVVSNWNIDFICFTDNAQLRSAGWSVVVVDSSAADSVLASRQYKINPHIFLADYDFSLYIDGNVKIVHDPFFLFQKYLANHSIAMQKHPDRDCSYAEASVCVEQGLADEQLVRLQMTRYASEGFPEGYGLTDNSIIFRRHLDKDIVNLMNAWWGEFCRGARRDQLSLQYLIWKNDLKIIIVEESKHKTRKYFVPTFHNKGEAHPLLRKLILKIIQNRHLNLFYYLMYIVINKAVSVRRNLPYR
jgi:hypothetical protein